MCLFVSLVGNKFICQLSKEYTVKESIINGNIEFYVNDNESIIGFAINNLDESALRTVKALVCLPLHNE